MQVWNPSWITAQVMSSALKLVVQCNLLHNIIYEEEEKTMRNINEYIQLCSAERGWTDAFENAISDLRAVGGGMIYVPAGKYQTYSIQLESNMTICLEAGAELCFFQNAEGYQVVHTEYEGKSQKMYMPFIYAKNAHNISITGYGTINGQGSYWWERQGTLTYARPCLICFENCSRVKLLDVTLINSPAWTVHPLYCKDVEIRGITIRNPKVSPNTDGINPNSCCNVRIADCLIDVGDDCISLKAGTEETPQKVPCENITIVNCNMIHGHGGVVIGSEMSGTVKNVTISNCVFQDTDRGIRVKTRRGRGGTMERIQVSNIIMDRVLCPFTFNMYYKCGAQGTEYKEKTAHPVDESTPQIRNIQINNVQVNDAKAAAGFFYGLPEMPIENVMISDCIIRMQEDAEPGHPAMLDDMDPMQGAGIFMRFSKNVVFRNVQVLNCRTENIDKDDSVEGFCRE